MSHSLRHSGRFLYMLAIALYSSMGCDSDPGSESADADTASGANGDAATQADAAAQNGVDGGASEGTPDAGTLDASAPEPDAQIGDDAGSGDAGADAAPDADVISGNLDKTVVFSLDAIYTSEGAGFGPRIPTLRVDGVPQFEINAEISTPGTYAFELFSDWDDSIIMPTTDVEVGPNGSLAVFYGNDFYNEVEVLVTDLMPPTAAEPNQRQVRLIHAAPLPETVSLRYVVTGEDVAAAQELIEDVEVESVSEFAGVPDTGVDLVLVDSETGLELDRETPTDTDGHAYTYVVGGNCHDAICEQPHLFTQFSCLGFFGDTLYCSEAERDADR